MTNDNYAPTSLDDCPWYDVAPMRRPAHMRADCGGRILDTNVGDLCENHANA